MKRKKGGWLTWLLVILLIIAGFAMRQTPGFSFAGYVLWSVAALLTVLRLLKVADTRFSRLLRKCLVWLVCIGIVVIAGTWIVVDRAAEGDEMQACEYIIVLGAGVNGTTPSHILSDRIDCAYTYLTEHPDVICIASGGKGDGENISEAQCIYDHLTKMGIPASRIWKEEQSTSTRENLRYSMALIEEKTGSRPEKAAILSSEFHLYRAGMFAREQGLEMIGVPAKTRSVFLRMNYTLRETVLVWYYGIFGG